MPSHIDRIRLANLRRLIAEAGSASALARRAGTSSAYLSQVRSARPHPSGKPRRLGERLAGRLERAMDKPPGWMDRLPEPDDGSIPWSLGGAYPLISWVQAGDWTDSRPSSPEPEAYLHCPVQTGPDAFALRVTGQSMEPRFLDGDYIFVDPDADPRSGRFVVVRRRDNDTATFKQLVEEEGRRYLKALNPEWPERILEAHDAVICGVVVFHGRFV